MTSDTSVAGLQRGDIFELIDGKYAGTRGAVISTEMLGQSLMEIVYLYEQSVTHIITPRTIRATITRDSQ